MQVEERKHWANRVLQMLKPLLSTDDKLTVLAGKDYRENLIKLFNQEGYKVNIPMEGLRNGEQKSWLKKNLTGKL